MSRPLTVEQFDPASPRRFEIVDLTVGVRSSALDSPNHGRVLSTSLVIEDLRNGNFGDVNDGKCALFIRTSVSGGIVSMSQMLRNLSPPRAEPVKRGLPTFSSLLPTVIWVKNSRSKKAIKQCLGGLKCSQNTKENKRTLKVNFKAIFNVHFANLVSKEYFSIQRLIIFLLYE